jgi:Flp pilus assembly protein TadG
VRVRSRSLGKRVSARLRASNEGGQALVEFAVVLPILLLIVTGIFAFGIALNQYLELTEAASVGARLLAVSRGQTADPCATAAAAISNAAPLLTSTSLGYSFVLNGNSYGASCPTSTNAGANLQQGVAATVTVTYPCNLTVYMFLKSPFNMTARVTELVQ